MSDKLTREEMRVAIAAAVDAMLFTLGHLKEDDRQKFIFSFATNFTGMIAEDEWKKLMEDSRKKCPDCECDVARTKLFDALNECREIWKEREQRRLEAVRQIGRQIGRT